MSSVKLGGIDFFFLLKPWWQARLAVTILAFFFFFVNSYCLWLVAICIKRQQMSFENCVEQINRDISQFVEVFSSQFS